jgi:uncharacterized membrane protein YbjE (DUF340 family)
MPSLLDIAALVIPLIMGMAIGYSLRGRKIFHAEKVTLGIILMLIFSLGFSIGSNTELLAVMPKVGLNATVLLTMALLFSILFVKAARRLVKI